jgi:hypothetical protein
MAAKKRAKRRSPRKRMGSVSGATQHRTKHKAHSRRRKVGAINPTAEIILGAIAGSFVTRVIEKNLPAPTDASKTDLRPYTGLVVGAAAEFFGKKNLLVRSMGIGALVEGARSIIQDKYIPDLKNDKPAAKPAIKPAASTAGLPYTVTGNRTRRLMGAPNALAGKHYVNGNRKMGATSTPQSLAGVGMQNHIIYDGM